MSACYSVSLRARIVDEAAFVRAAWECDEVRQNLPYCVGENNPPLDIIRWMLGAEVRERCENESITPDGWMEFHHAFNAGYWWETVMDSWFRAVAPTLAEGSELEVWPDEGCWRDVVGADGQVH